MLKITYQNKTFEFLPEKAGKAYNHLYAYIDLDEHWREFDYKNGGHTLNLGVSTMYEIPTSYYSELSKMGFFYDGTIDNVLAGIKTDYKPLFFVDLGITYSKIDFDNNFKSVLTGNINTHFPKMEELEQLDLSESICKNSLLRLGNVFLCDLNIKQIRFEEYKNNTLRLKCKAGFTNSNTWENGEVLIEEVFPINFYFRIVGYANEFKGKNIEQRFLEIEACFSSIYNISDYDLERTIIDSENLGVQIRFIKK